MELKKESKKKGLKGERESVNDRQVIFTVHIGREATSCRINMCPLEASLSVGERQREEEKKEKEEETEE